MTDVKTCRKVAYESKLEANTVLLRSWKKFARGNSKRRERQVYLCPRCGLYHLTSKEPE